MPASQQDPLSDPQAIKNRSVEGRGIDPASKGLSPTASVPGGQVEEAVPALSAIYPLQKVELSLTVRELSEHVLALLTSDMQAKHDEAIRTYQEYRQKSTTSHKTILDSSKKAATEYTRSRKFETSMQAAAAWDQVFKKENQRLELELNRKIISASLDAQEACKRFFTAQLGVASAELAFKRAFTSEKFEFKQILTRCGLRAAIISVYHWAADRAAIAAPEIWVYETLGDFALEYFQSPRPFEARFVLHFIPGLGEEIAKEAIEAKVEPPSEWNWLTSAATEKEGEWLPVRGVETSTSRPSK